MAVHYAGGGGGGLFGMLANAAINAATGGVFDRLFPGKAAASAAAPAAATAVNPQLENGLWAAHRQNGNPIPGNDVYVNMRMAQPPVVQPNESLSNAFMRAHRGRMPDPQSDPVTGRRY